MNSPPVTPPELTRVLRDAGTLEGGAVVNAAITERIKTTVSNLWFVEATYSRRLPRSGWG
jgi:hypothetical protein